MPRAKGSAAKPVGDDNAEAARRFQLLNNVSAKGVVSPKTAEELIIAFDKRLGRLESSAASLHDQIAQTTVLLKDLLKKVYATAALGAGVRSDTSSSTKSATQPAE